jgi:hypothetical protein
MNWEITDHDRSQGGFNWNKQHHSSLSDESEDAGSVGSAFFDEIMNDRTFLEGLEFMPGTVGLDKHVERAKDSSRKARKRTIHDSEEIPDLPLEDGILYLLNRKIFMIIQIILMIPLKICRSNVGFHGMMKIGTRNIIPRNRIMRQKVILA